MSTDFCKPKPESDQTKLYCWVKTTLKVGIRYSSKRGIVPATSNEMYNGDEWQYLYNYVQLVSQQWGKEIVLHHDICKGKQP